MAILTRSSVPRERTPYYMAGFFVLAAAFIAAQVLTFGNRVQWGTLALLPAAIWFGHRWRRALQQRRYGQAISARLGRLPRDFTVLHNLSIPAPWGRTQVDHVIISRFGIVVAADGPGPAWMLEQVEAVRSLLYARRLTTPQVPVRPLILLAPGFPADFMSDFSIPKVSVEQIRLSHLAPGQELALNQAQINAIAASLVELQRPA